MALIRPIPTKEEPILGDVVFGSISTSSMGIRLYNATTDTVVLGSSASGAQLSVSANTTTPLVMVTALEAGSYRVVHSSGSSVVTASANDVILNSSGSSDWVAVYKISD